MSWSPSDLHRDSYKFAYPPITTPDVEPATHFPLNYYTLGSHLEAAENREEEEDDKHTWAVRDQFAALDCHKLSEHEVLARLSVSSTAGLDKTQVQRLLQQYGKNVITPPKNNWFRKMFHWVFGGFGSLLVAASIICFIAWKPIGNGQPDSSSHLVLAILLLLVVLIQAIFNAWHDFSSSRVMASITGMLPSDVLVLRNNTQVKLPVKELVPGDLVTISTGDRVPADIRLIEVSADLQFDRSVLTGESDAVSGRVAMTDENFLETKNVALQGTHCVSGAGFGVVIQTGDRTVFAIMAKLSSAEHTRMTTLQRELMFFAITLVSCAVSMAVVMVILWAAWLHRSFPQDFSVDVLLSIVVTVMVSFIPEGLPIAVTLSLAQVASKLSEKLILCKSLSIVETLGSVNVLCSDKTGTLTQNFMHIDNLATFDTDFDSNPLHKNAARDAAGNLSQVVAIGAICNAATFDNNVAVYNKSQEKPVTGNATDAAILRFSDSVASVEITRQRWSNVYRANFNSKKKFMLQLSELSPTISLDGLLVPPLAPWDNYTRDCFLLSVKGAPEVLIPRCSHILGPAGSEPIPISPEIRKRITDSQERWSSSGQRVLLLARRIVRDDWLSRATDRLSEEFAAVVEEFNRDLIIVGLVGLINPLKPDIKHTVSTCRGAGIRFFIITGDHPTTALAIAGQAGIVTNTSRVHDMADLDLKSEKSNMREPKSIIITGQELVNLNPTQMERLCQYEEIVFARATPEQKLHIVREFKKRGNVVAVTGDGVNDGPSLKAADCGVAMGAGSDVAKESADLVLLGEFSSILHAIESGRLVYDNLQKTCIYLFPAGCFSELVPILLSAIIGVPQMIGNLQMLIFCVGTELLPALSLCLEQAEEGLLLRKPRNLKTDRLVNWKFMLHACGFIGAIECLCASSMAFWFLQERGLPFSSLVFQYSNPPNLTAELLNEATSVYFFTLVIVQWGNLFATRCRRLSIFQHPPSNKYIFMAPIASLCIGIFFCYVPGVQKVFKTHGIPAKFFFIPITFALAILILDELRKLVVRKYPRSIIALVAW